MTSEFIELLNDLRFRLENMPPDSATDDALINRIIRHVAQLSATPSADPLSGLVRYEPDYCVDFRSITTAYMNSNAGGRYALYSQAAEIIAYWKAECIREASLATDCAEDCNFQQNRAEAAETKLAAKDAEIERIREKYTFEDCYIDLTGGDYKAVGETAAGELIGEYQEGDRILFSNSGIDGKDLYILTISGYKKLIERAEAAETKLAAKDAEINKLNVYNGSYHNQIIELRELLQAYEAKLAQYEAQDPVAYIIKHPRFTDDFQTYELSEGDISNGYTQIPLYASPAPAADLKAENERLREALTKISSPTQTAGLLWWQVEARAALNVEASNDKG